MRNNQQCSTFHSSLHCLTNDRLSSFSIFSEVIFQSIKSLDPNKAHGQDEISLKMLKLCASSVRKPLLWFLRPASGKKYRTVSLLPICRKLLKKPMFKSTFNFVDTIQMGQSIQEWTKWNLWKTGFKKFEGVWSALNTQACSFIKKETLVQVFSFEFCKFFKNNFLL